MVLAAPDDAAHPHEPRRPRTPYGYDVDHNDARSRPSRTR
ncbi:MAG: hypothetical protein AVDCRST_MAG66-3770 [uncultured Pseudonocardia sp.]|uniref:Uncharacterized protein n=1 Tax=uncultured Pseudonocardia sp. TaxID=211455 RepID=A0A6J4QAV6_9PSEU|nr:MAG: hypothetical protein AVDCRST_MAG66-3770 [uncultured Pseudonocardia sp.]